MSTPAPGEFVTPEEVAGLPVITVDDEHLQELPATYRDELGNVYTRIESTGEV